MTSQSFMDQGKKSIKIEIDDPQYKKVLKRGKGGQKKLMFIYSEKATKFCEISTLDLTVLHTVKSKVDILQNFVAFSEYINFNIFHFIFQAKQSSPSRSVAGRGSQPDLPGTTKNGGLSNGGRAASTTSIPQPSPTGNNTSSIIKSLGKLKMETTGQLISE